MASWYRNQSGRMKRTAETAKCPMCGCDCANLFLRDGMVFGCENCEDIQVVDAVEYLEDMEQSEYDYIKALEAEDRRLGL